MSTEVKNRTCSVDILRLVCAIFVVAIHTSPFMDISEPLGSFVKYRLSTIAVPYFFAVAGFFYI